MSRHNRRRTRINASLHKHPTFPTTFDSSFAFSNASLSAPSATHVPAQTFQISTKTNNPQISPRTNNPPPRNPQPHRRRNGYGSFIYNSIGNSNSDPLPRQTQSMTLPSRGVDRQRLLQGERQRLIEEEQRIFGGEGNEGDEDGLWLCGKMMEVFGGLGFVE